MSRQSSFIRPTVTPEQVLSAYQHGLFPMSRGRHGSISWYIADPRAVIPLDERFRVRRSLRQVVERGEHRVTVNEDFESVIRACARHEDVTSEEVWLSEEMIALYVELHRRGHAHSVEVRRGGELAGGLYGIALGGAFFGESMFSRAPFGSQLALVALVARLRARGYALLDAQVMTPHLEQFGTLSLSHQDYITLLMRALREERSFV
jgi:leucyl/phenylalanyl-tRNA---protein transferase